MEQWVIKQGDSHFCGVMTVTLLYLNDEMQGKRGWT